MGYVCSEIGHQFYHILSGAVGTMPSMLIPVHSHVLIIIIILGQA